MSSETTPKTIMLRGQGLMCEGICTTAVTPGHLLAVSGTGVRTHNAEAGAAIPAFAVASLDGGYIDDEYAIDDNVEYVFPQPGAVVYGWLEAGSNAAINANLYSAGNGQLKVVLAAEGGVIVGKAFEAVNNGSGLTPVRIKVLVGVAGYTAPVV